MRSIIEWKFHDYRIDRSLNIFRINIPNRVCETIVDLLMHLGTIRLVEINCGDFFHSILFFLFPDKSPPTVVFSWLPENLIKLCACFVSTKITELRDSLLSIVFVRHRGKPSCFLFIQFSILLFTFVFHVQLQKFSINRNFFPFYIPKMMLKKILADIRWKNINEKQNRNTLYSLLYITILIYKINKLVCTKVN